ncbi:MAG: hypothetical protein WKF89_16800 [Chitinophagaceae bacterium]
MKRIMIASLLIATGLGLFAQATNKAKDLLKAKKVEDAKAEIDKVVTNEKNAKEGETWYIKSKVYGELANDTTLKSKYPTARDESFEAIKKYAQLDDKKLVSLTLDNYKPVMDAYQGYFKTGAAYYNSNNFADAYDNFKKCLEVSQYMNEKGWSNLKLDTSVVLYTGISAEKTNKKDEAAIYYGSLADAKVTGEGMGEIYKWLADYYSSKKDAANAAKYIDLGKGLYPKDVFWSSMELDMARDKGNKNELFTKYEDIIAKDPTNYLYAYNYGIELYKEAYKADTAARPANSKELITKAETHLKKALELKADYPAASLVLGQILYNQGVDLNAKSKLIKLPASGKLKPEDQKMKDDMKKQMMTKFDEAIPYFEKVDQILGSQAKLKMEEKSNLKDAYDLLITIYDQKGLKDKVKSYEEKFNDVDKAH